jgi:hypothetical protein
VLLFLPANCFISIHSTRAETQKYVVLQDIESGSPDPQGNYRWMDAADQLYAETYQNSYNYTQADVVIEYYTGAETFHGLLTAANLKPNFAYQLKLVGTAGTPSNELIGLAGRWWQEEWDGSKWTNGTNLNNKGDGSSPNPNDAVYFSRRDIPDATSPSGKHYKFTGYIVMDYFITDSGGNALLSFEANSSFHVLWKTSQRARSEYDGPIKQITFTGGNPDPAGAYDVVYSEATVHIFGEWERLPVGGVYLQPGEYEAQLVLTEESFHGSGLAGTWAGAMSGMVTFSLQELIIPTASTWSIVTLGFTLLAIGLAILIRRRSSAYAISPQINKSTSNSTVRNRRDLI